MKKSGRAEIKEGTQEADELFHIPKSTSSYVIPCGIWRHLNCVESVCKRTKNKSSAFFYIKWLDGNWLLEH